MSDVTITPTTHKRGCLSSSAAHSGCRGNDVRAGARGVGGHISFNRGALLRMHLEYIVVCWSIGVARGHTGVHAGSRGVRADLLRALRLFAACNVGLLTSSPFTIGHCDVIGTHIGITPPTVFATYPSSAAACYWCRHAHAAAAHGGGAALPPAHPMAHGQPAYMVRAPILRHAGRHAHMHAHRHAAWILLVHE